jgi:hypothetical protein
MIAIAGAPFAHLPILPWVQISGAIAGGLVGGFSGFVANNVQSRRETRRARRNVACAIIGEIGALSHHIKSLFLTVSALDETEADPSEIRRRHFRGERDYMPIFRALGSHVGVLPTPLPRDLVAWYTGLAMCLERARELHELRLQRDPDSFGYAMELARLQEGSLAELVELAPSLLEKLGSC